MKCTLFIANIVVFTSLSFSQSWKAVGENFHNDGFVNGMYFDTVNDRFFSFRKVTYWDTLTGSPTASHDLFELKNNYWDTLDVRHHPFAGGPLLEMIWYKGKYIVSGSITEFGSSSDTGYAQYVNGKFSPMPVKPNAFSYAMSVINDTLIFGGIFWEAGSIYSPGLLKYDGVYFYPFGNLNIGGPSSYPQVYDIIEFQNSIIICGFLYEREAPLKNHLIRIVKNEKEYIPGWQIDISGHVFDLEIFNNELYVAGYFSKSDGTSLGNNIVKWDGTRWYELGEGCNSAIKQMTVHDNYLVVAGDFTECDGIEAKYFAKWNGNEWCSFNPDELFAHISDLEVYKDTLYFSGNFQGFTSDTIRGIAKWVGGASIIECGPYNYVSAATNIVSEDTDINLFPNPAGTSVTLEGKALEKISNMKVYQFNGRLMMETTLDGGLNKTNINISDWPSGIYLLNLFDNQNVLYFSQKLIVRQ